MIGDASGIRYFGESLSVSLISFLVKELVKIDFTIYISTERIVDLHRFPSDKGIEIRT
jgi:hypothetical protein